MHLTLHRMGFYKNELSFSDMNIYSFTPKLIGIRQCRQVRASPAWVGYTGHTNRFAETVVLHKYFIWSERVIRESLEIHLTDKVINKGNGITLRIA